jgi:hypothetical protein
MGVGPSDAPPPDRPTALGDARVREPSLVDLKALALHARQRLALYRRRYLLGRGEPQRLAELERVSERSGATSAPCNRPAERRPMKGNA